MYDLVQHYNYLQLGSLLFFHAHPCCHLGPILHTGAGEHAKGKDGIKATILTCFSLVLLSVDWVGPCLAVGGLFFCHVLFLFLFTTSIDFTFQTYFFAWCEISMVKRDYLLRISMWHVVHHVHWDCRGWQSVVDQCGMFNRLWLMWDFFFLMHLIKCYNLTLNRNTPNSHSQKRYKISAQ